MIVGITVCAPAAAAVRLCWEGKQSWADARLAQLSLFLSSVWLGYSKPEHCCVPLKPCHADRLSDLALKVWYYQVSSLSNRNAVFQLLHTLHQFVFSRVKSTQVSVFYRFMRLLVFCCWLALSPHWCSGSHLKPESKHQIHVKVNSRSHILPFVEVRVSDLNNKLYVCKKKLWLLDCILLLLI